MNTKFSKCSQLKKILYVRTFTPLNGTNIISHDNNHIDSEEYPNLIKDQINKGYVFMARKRIDSNKYSQKRIDKFERKSKVCIINNFYIEMFNRYWKPLIVRILKLKKIKK